MNTIESSIRKGLQNMQVPPLPTRACACGRGHTFKPHNARHKYANEACKSWARRQRKNERSLEAEMGVWFMNLNQKARRVYKAICTTNQETAGHYWRMYKELGIGFVQDELYLIGSLISYVIYPEETEEAKALEVAGRQFFPMMDGEEGG
jgi:hypothetical protein